MLDKVTIKYFAKVGSGQGAPQRETDFSNDGFPFIRAGSLENLLNGMDECELPKVNEDIAREYKLKLYQPNTIVFAKSGMSALKGRIYKLKNPCYVVNHLATLELSDKAVADYVLFALRYFSPVRLINDNAYPSLKQSVIENYEIPFPKNKEFQLHIASILSKAENLIAQRKESIRLLDEFLKSTFLEMFGDPVRNEKGFESITLGELFRLSSGDGLTSENMNQCGKYYVYGGNGINGKHDKYMFDEPKIVIGRVGYYCGAVHLTEPKSWITDNALYIKKLYKDSNIQYLKHFLTQLKLNRYAGKAAQPLISGNRIYPVKTYYAPFELQTQFAHIVEKTEALKSQYQHSLQELENLYGSLSQKAFRGQLSVKQNNSVTT